MRLLREGWGVEKNGEGQAEEGNHKGAGQPHAGTHVSVMGCDVPEQARDGRRRGQSEERALPKAEDPQAGGAES